MGKTLKLKGPYGDVSEYTDIEKMKAPQASSGTAEFYDTTVKPDGTSFAGPEDVIKNKIFYANGGSHKVGTLEWSNYTGPYEVDVSGVPPITETLLTQNKFLNQNIVITTWDQSASYYCVQFVNGSNSYAWQYVPRTNGYVSEPQPPTPPQNKIFTGWEQDGELVEFPLQVTDNLELHASWMDVPDAEDSDYFIGFENLADTNRDLPSSIRRTGAARCIKPYTTTTNGRLVTMHNDMDNLFPFNEMTKVEIGQGSFIRIPKMYVKWKTVARDGKEVIDGIEISKQFDNSGTQPTFSTPFLPDCFLKADGSSENDSVLIGVYGASYDNEGTTAELISSRSGRSRKVSTTRRSFRDVCIATNGHTPGSGYTYQNWDLSIRTLFNFLCILYTGMPNYRAVVFPGRTGGGAEEVNAPAITGTCDGLENPNNSNLPASGWNLYTNSVKILGVEDPYGNCWEWIDGVNFNTSSGITYGGIQRFPNNFSDITSSSPFLSKSGIMRPEDNGFVRYLQTESAVVSASTTYYNVSPSGEGDIEAAHFILGDLNGDGAVTSDDAIYLLRHTLFSQDYPIIDYDPNSATYNTSVDGNRRLQLANFTRSGTITSDDATYLLRYILFPADHPLCTYTTQTCPATEAPLEIHGYYVGGHPVSLDYRSYVFPCETTPNNKKPSVGSYNETSDQSGAGSTLAMGGAWTKFTDSSDTNQIDAGLWTDMTSKDSQFSSNYIGARLCARPK